MKSLLKIYAICIVMGIVIFSIYAFASSNSGPEASGEGTGTISGWVISNTNYQLSNDPSLIQGVNFDLNAAASAVSVKLESRDTIFTACTNSYEYHWQCDFPSGVSISSMDELRVIAVGD